MRNRVIFILVAAFLLPDRATAQSFHRAGTEFSAVRSVTVPAGKPFTVVVTEFLHQGEIRPDGQNVVVVAGNKELVPMRILQLGPGDVCRLAFQTVSGQSQYDIFYGGDPPARKPPPWSCRDGLLLETRQFKPCDLRSLDSVRNAFEKAAPIGADYVNGVFQSYNPCSLTPGPFMSRYTGYLDIRKPGVYGLIVSSQDCSFLLIDDKLVASAPGRHGPLRRAWRGSRHDVTLAAGLHKFEYYHAAAGNDAMMVALWEPSPTGDKTQRPTVIPDEAFHWHLIARLPANRLATRAAKHAPDFLATLVADVPLPDDNVPLIGMLFRDVSDRALTMSGAKFRWDFGDGQTSNSPDVDHVYLRPGLYAVTLSIRHGGAKVESTNRIYVDRPRLTWKDKLYSFDEYLKIIETYDPTTLDALSLRQMVLALEAKSLALANRTEDEAHKARAAEEDPNRRPNARKDPALARKMGQGDSLSESERYLAQAVAAGKVAFADESAAKGDDELLKIAQLIGPMARDRLGEANTAFEIWRGAAGRIAAAEPKAECEVAAADIALNDLLKPAEAKRWLEAATKRLGKGRTGPVAAQLARVWGDYHAAAGDGKSARQAYAEAEQLGGSTRSFTENAALRAHARSTEDFIKEKQFARAAGEIQAWQRDFPTKKIDGYLTLLCARYWAGRGKFAQAIAQSERLQAVNPESPYMDQLLFVAADSEMRRGRKDRALATLHSLVKDHPGSPLAPLAKKNIEALEREKERD